ncbi:MAG: hypothetical protein VB141_04150, partial [Burkholderia gladioli]
TDRIIRAPQQKNEAPIIDPRHLATPSCVSSYDEPRLNSIATLHPPSPIFECIAQLLRYSQKNGVGVKPVS